jgi:hypothetical protein
MHALKLKFPDGRHDASSAGYAILMLGIISLIATLYQFKLAVDDAAYWDLRVAAMDRRGVRRDVPTVSQGQQGRHSKKEVQKANTILSEIDLPWEALLDSLEYASGHDVALLSFHPDPEARTVLIGGEARNLPSLLDFVSALEREPALRDAYLVKYEVKRDDPQRPLVFSITSSWIEAS